jgi:hypothetical protein
MSSPTPSEVVADDAYAIQPGDEAIAIERRELTNDLRTLIPVG